MAMRMAPTRGGFLRPFGCGWFIREFLLGNGPGGSTKIDPNRGSTQTDINFEYKDALARATARERAEKIISDMVVKGADVTEEEAEKIYQRESRKSIPQIYPHAVSLVPDVLRGIKAPRMGGSHRANRAVCHPG